MNAGRGLSYQEGQDASEEERERQQAAAARRRARAREAARRKALAEQAGPMPYHLPEWAARDEAAEILSRLHGFRISSEVVKLWCRNYRHRIEGREDDSQPVRMNPREPRAAGKQELVCAWLWENADEAPHNGWLVLRVHVPSLGRMPDPRTWLQRGAIGRARAGFTYPVLTEEERTAPLAPQLAVGLALTQAARDAGADAYTPPASAGLMPYGAPEWLSTEGAREALSKLHGVPISMATVKGAISAYRHRLEGRARDTLPLTVLPLALATDDVEPRRTELQAVWLYFDELAAARGDRTWLLYRVWALGLERLDLHLASEDGKTGGKGWPAGKPRGPRKPAATDTAAPVSDGEGE
jgi:hypothetical protein